VRGKRQLIVNRLRYAVNAGQNVVIPESQHTKSKRFKMHGALRVIWRLLRMLAPIYFNHKPSVQTHEVRYVRTYRVLPPELEAFEGSVPQ
jgi:hypothetical protein